MATQTSTTAPLILGSGSSVPTSELQNPSVTVTNIEAIRNWISLVIGHTHTYTDIVQTGYTPVSTVSTTGTASGFTGLAPLSIVAGQPLDSHAFNDMIAALQSGVLHSHPYTDTGNGTSTTSVATNPIPLPAPVSPGSSVLESDRAQLVSHIAWYSGHTHTYADNFVDVPPPPAAPPKPSCQYGYIYINYVAPVWSGSSWSQGSWDYECVPPPPAAPPQPSCPYGYTYINYVAPVWSSTTLSWSQGSWSYQCNPPPQEPAPPPKPSCPYGYIYINYIQPVLTGSTWSQGSWDYECVPPPPAAPPKPSCQYGYTYINYVDPVWSSTTLSWSPGSWSYQCNPAPAQPPAPPPLHYITGTSEDPQSTSTSISYTCPNGSYNDPYSSTTGQTHTTNNNLLVQTARCAASVTGCDTCSSISQVYSAANTTGNVPYYVSTRLKSDNNNVILLYGYPSNLVGTQNNALVVQVNGPPGHTVYVLAPETDLWGNIYVGANILVQGRTSGSGTCNYEDQGDLWVYQLTLDGNGNGQFGLYSTAQNGGKFMIGIVDATLTGMSNSDAISNCFGINNYLCNAMPWSMAQANFCSRQYAPSMGGSCFPAGSQVLMPDLTTKNIEDIVEGELIMGANGVPVPVEIMDRVTLSYNRNGGVRKLFTMKDGSLMWSEEHLFWSKDTTNAEWWWGTDPDQWRHEVFTDHVVGLKDNYSVRQGDGVVLAHLDGWKDLDYEEVPGMVPELPLFLPRCDGTPIIVNGYVVTAGTNEFRFDYSQFKWDPEKIKAVQQ